MNTLPKLKIIYSEGGQTASFSKEPRVPGFKCIYVEWACDLAAKLYTKFVMWENGVWKCRQAW